MGFCSAESENTKPQCCQWRASLGPEEKGLGVQRTSPAGVNRRAGPTRGDVTPALMHPNCGTLCTTPLSWRGEACRPPATGKRPRFRVVAAQGCRRMALGTMFQVQPQPIPCIQELLGGRGVPDAARAGLYLPLRDVFPTIDPSQMDGWGSGARTLHSHSCQP